MSFLEKYRVFSIIRSLPSLLDIIWQLVELLSNRNIGARIRARTRDSTSLRDLAPEDCSMPLYLG